MQTKVGDIELPSYHAHGQGTFDPSHQSALRRGKGNLRNDTRLPVTTQHRASGQPLHIQRLVLHTKQGRAGREVHGEVEKGRQCFPRRGTDAASKMARRKNPPHCSPLCCYQKLLSPKNHQDRPAEGGTQMCQLLRPQNVSFILTSSPPLTPRPQPECDTPTPRPPGKPPCAKPLSFLIRIIPRASCVFCFEPKTYCPHGNQRDLVKTYMISRHPRCSKPSMLGSHLTQIKN